MFHELQYFQLKMEVYFISIICTLCIVLTGVLGDSSKGRGFGENIDWVQLEEGRQIAKDSNKPLMLLIHKSWCGACKALKPKFAASEQIQELSKQFVMVNTEDDEEPQGQEFQPDGGYIPRILFLDPAGTVQTDIINAGGSAQYKYYYANANAVIQGMKGALKQLGYTANEEL